MGYRDGNFKMMVTFDEAIAVQRAVFDAGGSWASGDKEVIRHLEVRFLCIENLNIARFLTAGTYTRYDAGIIRPHVFIEGLRVETPIIDNMEAFRTNPQFYREMQDAEDRVKFQARLESQRSILDSLSPSLAERMGERMIIASTPWNRDGQWERVYTDTPDDVGKWQTSGVAAEPLSADSLDTLQGLLGAGYGASTQALNDMQTDLDTETDNKIEEALHSCILSSKPRNIFEEKKQLKQSKQSGVLACYKCGAMDLHWECLQPYTRVERWWLHDKKGTPHQCDPFRDKTFLTPEEQELEGLKGVYRVLELDTMEPVKRKEEKFIRCLEID